MLVLCVCVLFNRAQWEENHFEFCRGLNSSTLIFVCRYPRDSISMLLARAALYTRHIPSA